MMILMQKLRNIFLLLQVIELCRLFFLFYLREVSERVEHHELMRPFIWKGGSQSLVTNVEEKIVGQNLSIR